MMNTGSSSGSPDWLKLSLSGTLVAGSLMLSQPALAQDAAPAAPADPATPAEKAEQQSEAAEPAAESAEAEAPAELTPEQLFEGGAKPFTNWVEVGMGGLIVDGDKGMAEQRQQVNEGMFGGIQDLHYQHGINASTILTLDGKAIFGPEDYALRLGLTKENVGFVRFSFENFTSFYDTSGGFFEPDNLHFSLKDDAWELSRGSFSFEAGVVRPKVPKITFKYTHRYRDGEKDSTIWAPVQTSAGLRGLYPGWYSIDENSDTIELDATASYKATAFGVGLRYENGEVENAYKTTFRPVEPVRRALTDSQGTSYDMVSVHAWTETWIKRNLSFSTGFLFANLDNDFSGSRIYGDDFDVNFAPNTLNPLGYFDLNGGAHKQEYVANLNLMAVPLKNLTVVPSLKIMKEDWDANSSGIGTLGNNPTEPFGVESQRDFLEVRERVDLRYNGITNWVFFAGPELAQGSGNIRENGGLSRVNDIGVAAVQTDTDDSRFYQKYFAGIRWYPAPVVTLDVGGYYKLTGYEWDHNYDSTSNEPISVDRYPAFFEMQDFETYDANARLTLRPHKKVSLVSRYEYQDSTITTGPVAESGLGEVDSSHMISHIFAQNLSWTPCSRVTLQGGFNYVESETETPTSDFTEAVLDARNNYWTAQFNALFVVDDKTDLSLGYFHYQSDNYDGNPTVSLPLGAAATENGLTATIVRRITENVRLNLKYGYSHYNDYASGQNDSYEAHLVYSSLQYRF